MAKRKNGENLNTSSDMPLISFKEKNTRVRILDYDEKNFKESEAETINECFPLKDTSTVSWIDIDNINQTEIIKQMDECFELHPLIIEDIKNLDQRPKIEDFEEYLYIIFKVLKYNKNNELEIEQISTILGKNFVITFQAGKEGDVFEPVREKIRNKKGKIRRMKTDYLVYRLIDSATDNYFKILERLRDKVEILEEELVSDPNRETIKSLYKLKKDIIMVRNAVWPLREVVNNLEREESPLIKKSTKVYLRDLYHTVIQLIDNVELTRENISGMLDIYLSSVSNKTNEVMKVLTIIATIFMPLTFFAGVYGMNFKFFPEIYWRYGYGFFWAIVITTIVIMLIYFKKRKWI
jgi:magnesium transporter